MVTSNLITRSVIAAMLSATGSLVSGCSSEDTITATAPETAEAQYDNTPRSDDTLAVVSSESRQPETSQDGYHVLYTAEEGFIPKRLDVPVGAEVIFVNNSDGFMWPASNIHPTHNILPSFDPQKGIKPGETWAYRFEENGYWRYHDHIEPSQSGLIVSSGDSKELEPLDMRLPDLEFPDPPASAAQDYDLYDDGDLADFLKTYGLSATAELLKEIELNNPGTDCHTRAHELGHMAFTQLGAAAFALASHQCQSGVFHGTTEALFAARGTANLTTDVTTVCSLADNPFMRHQCLHGVGHGLMAWTTYELHETLGLCDNLLDSADRGSCYSGVFMENGVGGLSETMGHTTEYLKADDPHFPCDVVAEQYVLECYFFQTSHMRRVFDNDYSKIVQACLEAPHVAHFNCFNSYGRDVGSITPGDPASAIEYCNLTPAGDYRAECIEGAVQNRFWEKPGADEAISMCGMLEEDDIDDISEDTCYQMIIIRAGNVFSNDTEREDFCTKLPESRKQSCLRRIIANTP